MKYELMALVNSIARQESANGSDELATNFEYLYDELSNAKEAEVTPIGVGEEIFDIYFNFGGNRSFKEPKEEAVEKTEYKKPFFVDPDLLEKQALEQAAKASGNEYEEFIFDLMAMLNIRQPRGFQQNMKNYMGLIKRRVQEIQQENSDNGWLINPDRMGK